MMTEISRALLSSLFYATEFADEKHEILKIEIDVEDFQIYFHKVMAHLYIHLKNIGEPVTFDVALIHLSKQNVLDEMEFLNIMSATPFGTKNTVDGYLKILRNDNKKSLIGRI